jgi:hypothetical protein
MGIVERLLQNEFRELNVKYDAGTEFYNKKIITLIEPYLITLGIMYKKLTKQEIMLHGRQTAGYSYIKPAGGKVENNPELQKYAFSWYDNPNVNPSGDIAQTYAGNTGTVYAVKGKQNTFINDANRSVSPNFKKDTVFASQQNQIVIASVSMTGLNSTQKAEAIQSMLKRAGVKIPKKK